MNTILCGVIDATVNYDDLKKLVLHRLPSAIQFGGRYRLIDFNLSNFKNSGIRNVAIFPNGNYRSLTDHISSGKIWDLDRKRDGLFILPPKKVIRQSQEMISFRRMKEHMEYFLRSKQEYIVITSGVIVWNINFFNVLQNHLESQKDITEVIAENKKLNTYILKKEALIKLILHHEYLGYKNLKEVVEFSNDYRINNYYHDGYTKMISTLNDLYDCNMDILDFEIGRTIFTEEAPILSKSKDFPPAFYGDNAMVSQSLIANGSKINGRVENSVISRSVEVEEGVKIKDSIIMQQSKIMTNAILDYCVIDKNVTIGENVVLKGTKEKPIVIEKAQKVLDTSKMSVIHVGSECAPFVKTGGLADVLAALPKKQRELGIDVSVCLPLYQPIIKNYHNRLTHHMTFSFNEEIKCDVYTLNIDGVSYYFIAINDFFLREHLYNYPDDLKRYYYFNLATLTFIQKLEMYPNIIHLHDYHVGLIPILLKKRFSMIQSKTCFTIHNLQYRGIYTDVEFIQHHLSDVTKEGTIHFLRNSLENADFITTVSPTYSKEIQYKYYSQNLQSLIIKRKNDIVGILNGLDYDIFHPNIDTSIKENYNFKTIDKKIINKRYLQYSQGLIIDDEIPVIGMVTRLVEQKGLDLVIEVFSEIMKEKVQFVILGTGDKTYEEKFKEFESQYPKYVKANIGFDSYNSNQIYAGIDLFLMPSRFEPCGLSQMIALIYGSIPIVRETGGLKDTVIAYNELTQIGNGFTFLNYNAQDMLHTIKRALSFYHDKNNWHQIMQNAMESHFSYETTAQKYYHLYDNILK